MDDQMKKFAEQLQQHPAMLKSLMQSQDGQTLLRLLTQQDRGASFQRATQSAMRGNPNELTQMVQQIMQSPSGAALVERIRKAAQS